MTTEYCAGHSFNDVGICTSAQRGTDIPCPIRWRDISWIADEPNPEAHYNAKGIAHWGDLSATEIASIIAKRLREREAIEKAMLPIR